MARTHAVLPEGARLSDFVAVGVLAKAVPLDSILAALNKLGRASRRERDLPAHVHDELIRPIETEQTRGAWYRRWRLVSPAP